EETSRCRNQAAGIRNQSVEEYRVSTGHAVRNQGMKRECPLRRLNRQSAILISTMGKRIFLFLATNLAVVLMLSVIASVLGIGNYLGRQGIDISGLAFFSLFWGMGGAFISLLISRWTAKRALGVELVSGRTGNSQADWLYQTVERLTRQAN